jgi:hypothetical protein
MGQKAVELHSEIFPNADQSGQPFNVGELLVHRHYVYSISRHPTRDTMSDCIKTNARFPLKTGAKPDWWLIFTFGRLQRKAALIFAPVV